MTIKQHGGVFGRNPKFNSVEAESLSIAGNAVPDASTILVDGDIGSTVQGYDADTAKLDAAQTFTAAQTFNENIVMANGKGIDFSATAGTGTSELFDDYEEGTWTPTLTTNGTDFDSVTYDAVTSGIYTKIGNVVKIRGRLRTDAVTVGSASGNVNIGGLPFAVPNSAAYVDSVIIGDSTDWATNNPTSGRVSANSNNILLLYRTAANGASAALPYTDVDTGANDNNIYFSAVYHV